MPVWYKTSDMKIKDYWSPYFSRGLKTKFLVSTYIQRRELPTIQMELKEPPFVRATAKFNYIYLIKNKENKVETEHYTRIIEGPSSEVYKIAARVASRIGLNIERQFNSEWNKTLMQLLNKPSKDKRILNLGLYKKDG